MIPIKSNRLIFDSFGHLTDIQFNVLLLPPIFLHSLDHHKFSAILIRRRSVGCRVVVLVSLDLICGLFDDMILVQ